MGLAAGRIFKNDAVSLEAIELVHHVPSFTYSFTEPMPSRALDGKKFLSLGVSRDPLWGKLNRGEPVVLEDGQSIDPDDCLRPPRRARSIIIAGDKATPAMLENTCSFVDCLVH